MKIDEVHLDAHLSGIVEVGGPCCRPCLRRLTAFGVTFLAFLGGVFVESASADDWSMIDGSFANPPAEFRPQTRSTPHCPSRRGA